MALVVKVSWWWRKAQQGTNSGGSGNTLQHLLLKVQMVVKVMASFSILVVTIDGVVVEAEAVVEVVQLVADLPKVLTVVQEHNQS